MKQYQQRLFAEELGFTVVENIRKGEMKSQQIQRKRGTQMNQEKVLPRKVVTLLLSS